MISTSLQKSSLPSNSDSTIFLTATTDPSGNTPFYPSPFQALES
ncbi:hypothetical protein HanXRQr2_Chr11g0487091 [Helianthus annuus]|uniref:Uncharacterized protein n=1 Tax=Helianthus annuus TaxID=4232 RepID=A0A9K3HNE6_HELAN|nr:hypothetical protein HanXRQr2_Chr11g0487091 [Helianthus annuus]KAJ0874856.1 hypothetical protein HanPSC8_Chr11g0469281 [Helianthus annuus]